MITYGTEGQGASLDMEAISVDGNHGGLIGGNQLYTKE